MPATTQSQLAIPHVAPQLNQHSELDELNSTLSYSTDVYLTLSQRIQLPCGDRAGCNLLITGELY